MILKNIYMHILIDLAYIYIILLIPCLMAKAAWSCLEWQYRLELLKLCYHPWLAADEGMVSHMLPHVV